MIVDILVLIVVALSAIIAFLRGFIREVLTIAGVLGGLAAAYYLGPHVSPVVRGWLDVQEGSEEKLFDIIPYTIVADGLAYAAIFILVVIILSIISHFIAETVKSIGLGAVDRTLGVIFGIVRGVLLLAILYMPVHLLVENDTKDDWFDGSRTHIYLEETADWLSGFLPEETRKELEETAEEMSDDTKDKLENMELLKKDGDNTEENASEDDSKGYTPEFRDDMNRLFEQNDGTQE